MKLVLICSLLILGYMVKAQVPRNSELFIALQKHDSIFFERAFNKCDSVYTKAAVSDDLVFYHDKGGVQNKQLFLHNVSHNLCSDMSNKPIRKVRPETLEVYPLYNNDKLYGVVQMGVHDFYLRKPNLPDQQTGTAKFTHVYLLKDGNWLLTQVLSFDHK